LVFFLDVTREASWWLRWDTGIAYHAQSTIGYTYPSGPEIDDDDDDDDDDDNGDEMMIFH
jgi:hypothetical protein